MRRAATFIVLGLALLTSTPAAAQEMTIALPFGPSATVPEPRARQNGWLANRAGVSETLMGLDHDMGLFPRLAEGIEAVDPLTWRVSLREGVRFHDGSVMDAEAVIASIAALAEDGHPAHNPRLVNLLDLAGMAADGPGAVVFRTKAPNAAFPWTLTEPGVAILAEPTPERPINGTGPFVFREAVVDQFYSVEANPDHWGGAPRLDGLRLVAIPDPATAMLAFEAGEVDIVTNFPEADFARMASRPGVQALAEPTTRLFFLIPNTASGPLSEPAIRRAVSLAIDREGVVAAALSGVGGVPAATVFPPMMPWAADIEAPYDPEAARALLDDVGATVQGGRRMWQGAPLALDVWTYEGRAGLRPTVELLQVFLADIGIETRIRIAEYGANNDALRAGEIDISLQAWGAAPQGDPSYFPETLLATGADFNLGGYSNPRLDALLAQGRQESDFEARRVIYDEVQRIVAEEASLIPVFHATQLSVARDTVEGFRIHPAETYLAHPGLGFRE